MLETTTMVNYEVRVKHTYNRRCISLEIKKIINSSVGYLNPRFLRFLCANT